MDFFMVLIEPYSALLFTIVHLNTDCHKVAFLLHVSVKCAHYEIKVSK